MARRVSSPQIVGREETLAALEAALARAIEGDPGLNAANRVEAAGMAHELGLV